MQREGIVNICKLHCSLTFTQTIFWRDTWVSLAELWILPIYLLLSNISHWIVIRSFSNRKAYSLDSELFPYFCINFDWRCLEWSFFLFLNMFNIKYSYISFNIKYPTLYFLWLLENLSAFLGPQYKFLASYLLKFF